MSKLNQGLLLISKIENNQFRDLGEINLQMLLDKTTEHFEEMIDHRKISVSKNYQYDVRLNMNPALAEIFITNMVSNAIRHNIVQGRIDINVMQDYFSITNTGQMMKTDPTDLFERFRKSGNNPDSVGLGLSIVQKIANLYNMKVEYLYCDGLHTLKVSYF
jgi:signal transduction histidine kinase